MEERQADDVQPRHGGHDAARVNGPTVGADDREVDPVVVRLEARAPDDVRGLDEAPVPEDRQAILRPHHPFEHPLDPGGLEIRRPDALERPAMVTHQGHGPAPDRCREGRDVVDEEPEGRVDDPCQSAVRARRHLALVGTREDRPVLARCAQRDLRARDARAHHEHGAGA